MSIAQSIVPRNLVTDVGFKYFVVVDALAHPIPDARAFYGFVNLATAAQTATMSAFDNTAASGQLLAPAIALAASGTYSAGAPGGIQVLVGLTVQASATPTTGILVLYR